MKTLVAAALLLALTSPAFAAKADPRDFSIIRKWQAMDFQCYRAVIPEDDTELDVEITQKEYDKTTRGRACLAAKALQKKLEAKGYCTYAKDGVGRAGSKYFYPGIDSAGTNSHWRRHCYEITNMPERLD